MKHALILALLVVLGIIFLAGCNTNQNKVVPVIQPGQNNNNPPNLEGKTVQELRLLNMPIECTVIKLLDEKRSQRKEGEAYEVPTQLFIEGNKVREVGVSIWTNGSESHSLNILTSSGYYSLLLNSDKMINMDVVSLGGEDVLFSNIPAADLQCKVSTFEDNIFVPQNVCYPPGSSQEPKCF